MVSYYYIFILFSSFFNFFKRSDKLFLSGIIAEFNPLHTGHKFLIDAAKKDGAVVCVISGNFVQRGDTAIAEKRIRTQMALNSGADLVLELPVYYSCSTAQNFAFGGVSILDAIGCDRLVFGSECGDTEILNKASEILNSQEFSQNLKQNLRNGVTFAAAREQTAISCGLQNNVLNKPNNNLAIEYIGAIKQINSKMSYETVKRIGTGHDSNEITENFVSASLLREKLIAGDYGFCQKYIDEDDLKLLKRGNLSSIKNIENTILGILRTKSITDLSALPDLSEGVENKLFSAIKVATSLEELYNELKVKRYTHARIRRLVISAVLGADSSLFMKKPPYIRVLGFNKIGEEIIKNCAYKSKIPVIMRAKEIENLGKESQKVFSLECTATDLYALSLNKPLECGLEYKSKLVKG